MKFLKLFSLFTFSIFILSSCNFLESTVEEEGNLIQSDTVTEGYWIGFKGEPHENDDYVYTESINYNPMSTYNISRNAYISYYDDDEFIRTVQQGSEDPIPTESNANNIVVSFNKDRIDTIELTR